MAYSCVVKNYTPKVGDLVCYNSAGMRKHSLGLVTEVRDGERLHGNGRYVPYVYIEWIEKPSMPPRSEFHWTWRNGRDEHWTPEGTSAGWYQDLGCFEVIEKK